jgi:NAD(P)H-dependent flavin oxidoreductase YrpB (nitropropane dioxygenase family)
LIVGRFAQCLIPPTATGGSRDNVRIVAVVLRTPLCRELGIEYPIFSVGFGAGAGPELVAVVSNAGGFGVLGGANRSLEEIPPTIERTREWTKRPFGVNFILAALEDRDTPEEDKAEVRRQVEAAIAERVAAIVLFWGDPAPFVDDAHRSGVKVLVQVGSVEEAKTAVDTGVDAVIAQGVEAGGHVRGTTPIWELLPATVEAVKPVPVLASGGIGDGAGLARALELGAQGVSLGTRFVASEEAWIHPAHKQRVVESTAADTVYSELYDAWWPGAPHRTLRNKTFEEWEAADRPPPGKRPGEGKSIGKRRLPSGELQDWPRYAVGLVPPNFEGDIDSVPMLVGESCSVVNEIKPAGQIVKDLAHDAEAALAASGQLA